jgi:hypothetical protein
MIGKSLSLLMLSLLLFYLSGLAIEGNEPQPEVVITNPSEETELSIKVWLDKGAYEAGERLGIHFTISRDCYVYIYDISPEKKVSLLFPNAFQQANLLQAGSYTIPDTRYSLVVEGSPGVEYLQAIASTEPIGVLAVPPSVYKEAPFPTISTEPQGLKKEIAGLAPQGWAANWTSFYLLEPGRAWLAISSEPSEAEAYINGRLVGSTPLALSVKPGYVRVLLEKEGYESWVERLYLERNAVKEIEAQLSEVPPLPPPTSLPVPLEPGVPLPSLGLNLGLDWESLGVEVKCLPQLWLGVAARFTGERVPDYYEVELPEEPWPDELVYNAGPEMEFYLKLNVPLWERLVLALGGGWAVQERVHIATPPVGGLLAEDVTIKPNGYKTAEDCFTGLGGLVLRWENFFLEVDYHNRRGLVLGAGIEF